MTRTDSAVSCARSGLVIVFLLFMAVSLSIPLQTRQMLRDLGTYIATRNVLATQILEIDENICLKNQEPKNKKISQLVSSSCFEGKKQNSALDALKALEVFKDITVIEKARILGYSADFSIYRWGLRFHNLVESSGGKIEDLTLERARELAKYEFPEMADYKDLFYRHELLSTPWTLLPVRLDRAATLVELGLAFSLAYFWVFLQEATRSGTFEQEETIFSAFSRTRVSRFLFFVFAATPPVVACRLTIESYYAGTPLTKLPFFREDICLQGFSSILILIISSLIWRTAKIQWKRLPNLSAL